MASSCKTYDSIIDFYNSQKNLVHSYGKIYYKDDGKGEGYKKSNGMKWLDNILQYYVGTTLDSSINYTTGQANLIKRNIMKQEKQLLRSGINSKMWSTMGVMWDTVFGRKILNGFASTENRHRLNIEQYTSHIGTIQNDLYNALEVTQGLKKGEVKKILSDISDLEKDIAEGRASQGLKGIDPSNQDKINMSKQALEKILSDNKEVFRHLESYLDKNYIKESKTFFEAETNESIDPSVVALGNNIISFYKNFGGVGISGMRRNLSTLRNIAKSDVLAKNINSSSLDRSIDKLDSYIDALHEKMVGDDGYRPDYLLNDLGFVLEKIDNVFELTKKDFSHNELETAIDLVSETIQGLSKADNLKGKVGTGDYVVKNPLTMVLKYGHQMTEYNRDAYFKGYLLDSMASLTTMDNAHLKSMMDFAIERYKVAQIGYMKRSDWVNKTMRAIGSYEYANKILNISTGLQNASQMKDFISTVGLSAYREGRSLYKSNQDIKNIILDIEKDYGFSFVPEAALEGLMPELGRVTAIDIDLKDGLVSIDSQKKGVVKLSLDKLIQKSGKLFAWTEQVTRNEIFKVTIANSLNALRKQGLDLGDTVNLRKAKNIAIQQALWNVNDNAFEYAIWNKAKWEGGNIEDIGAVGQLFGQFKHYRLSQFDKLARHIKNTKTEGIFEPGSNKLNPAAKALAGISLSYSFNMALSAVIGLSFKNFLGQDTIETVSDLVSNIDDPKKISHGHGLLGNITPPILDDLMRAGMTIGMINAPNSELARIMLGSQMEDFKERDRTTEFLRLINVFVAKTYQDYSKGFGVYTVPRHLGLTFDEDVSEHHNWLREKNILPKRRSKKKSKDPLKKNIDLNTVPLHLRALYKQMGYH